MKKTALLFLSIWISGCVMSLPKHGPQTWRREHQALLGVSCCLLWNPCGDFRPMFIRSNGERS